MRTEMRGGTELEEWYIESSHESHFSMYFNFHCRNSPYNLLKLYPQNRYPLL